MDEKQRIMWDSTLKTMEKIGKNKYKLTYQSQDKQNNTFSEELVYHWMNNKDGSLIISEQTQH